MLPFLSRVTSSLRVCACILQNTSRAQEALSALALLIDCQAPFEHSHSLHVSFWNAGRTYRSTIACVASETVQIAEVPGRLQLYCTGSWCVHQFRPRTSAQNTHSGRTYFSSFCICYC
jgi:hypothetical protein